MITFDSTDAKLTILNWRQAKHEKPCPSCSQAMLEDGKESSQMGKIAFYRCECGRREMIYEKPQDKAREY